MANTVANSCGFTHPTMLAILGLTGVSFGLINVWGFVGSIGIYVFAYWRAKREMIAEGHYVCDNANNSDTEDFVFDLMMLQASLKPYSHSSHYVSHSFMGVPVFIVGFICSILVIIMAKYTLADGEKAMISGAYPDCYSNCCDNQSYVHVCCN